MDLEAVGEAIRAQRRALGLSQADVATKAAVSRSTLAALERGRMRELGFNKVGAILTAIGLEMKVGPYNAGRPTLDDLRAENERELARLDR